MTYTIDNDIVRNVLIEHHLHIGKDYILRNYK